VQHWAKAVWDAMWPNIFAPSFFTLLGYSLGHWRLRKHIDRRHEQMKEHVTKGIGNAYSDS